LIYDSIIYQVVEKLFCFGGENNSGAIKIGPSYSGESVASYARTFEYGGVEATSV